MPHPPTRIPSHPAPAWRGASWLVFAVAFVLDRALFRTRIETSHSRMHCAPSRKHMLTHHPHSPPAFTPSSATRDGRSHQLCERGRGDRGRRIYSIDVYETPEAREQKQESSVSAVAP